jgi:hypothetical protein
VPKECAGQDAYLLSYPTANMSNRECEISFIPRYAPDCEPDSQRYIERWGKGVYDSLEKLLANQKDKETLFKWIEEARKNFL